MRQYTYLTKKKAHCFVEGEARPLQWQKITPMTRDPSIRSALPGEYALVEELDLVYIIPHRNK